ncbi:MAG: purine-nucleoside phosphorylase [Chloroflexota bacterium]|nr:purine-nucleoside phosphorylase [Chloroflexota bacterium]
MPTILLRAEAGDRPPDVLLVEDPEHALRAVALLEGGQAGSELISDHRGLPAFRGRWAGHPVTIQTTGLGGPAVAMVVEELLMVGARRFLRVAPAMAVAPSLQAGTAVVAMSASAIDGTTRTYLGSLQLAPTADFGLTTALVHGAHAAGMRLQVGSVATVDLLPDDAGRKGFAACGILAADLGTAPLFVLAARDDAKVPSSGPRVLAAAILWIDASDAGGHPAASRASLDALLRVALDVLSDRRAG